MKKEKIRYYQDVALKSLSGRIDEFYLSGGTALSLFYFQRRLSSDLDFFTKDFSVRRIKEIVSYMSSDLDRDIELMAQSLVRKHSRMLVYYVHFTKQDILKIDFVEDAIELIKPIKAVEGIKILSLEDIYLRKLYAVSGALPAEDEIGRPKALGGRVDAKDFFDLYYLSHTFMSMAGFIKKYGNSILIEGIIRWFRSYDRMKMIDDVLTLDVPDKNIDYKKMEQHFKKEVDKIIENTLEGV